MPKFASKRTLQCAVFDEILLVRRQRFNFEGFRESGDVRDDVGLRALVVVPLAQTFSQAVFGCDFVED